MAQLSFDIDNDQARLDIADLRDKIAGARPVLHRYLFLGRAASGKSSLIRSIYFVFHDTMDVPVNMQQQLRVRGSMQEGTTLFNMYCLWPVGEGPDARAMDEQITFLDSRGLLDGEDWTQPSSSQHWQIKAILQGQFKEGAEIAVERRPWPAFWRTEYQVPDGSAVVEEAEIAKPHCVALVEDYEDTVEWHNPRTGVLARMKDLVKLCSDANIPHVVVITKIDLGKPGAAEVIKQMIQGQLQLREDQVFVVENHHARRSGGPLEDLAATMKREHIRLLDALCKWGKPDVAVTPSERISIAGCAIT